MDISKFRFAKTRREEACRNQQNYEYKSNIPAHAYRTATLQTAQALAMLGIYISCQFSMQQEFS